MAPVIVNASPLIFLSKGGELELLAREADTVIVPLPVAREIRQRGASDVTVRAMEDATWLSIADPPAVPSSILAWGLGPGKSAVLAMANATPGARAVLDDRAGRRCAESHGIPVIGTLGLVLRAKATGAIPAARPVVERLVATGMYLRRSVIEDALALVGE